MTTVGHGRFHSRLPYAGGVTTEEGISVSAVPPQTADPTGAHSAGGAPSPTGVEVGASTVRERLQLTPHQLGELTRRLGLDVGDRPNYPRYGSTQVHLLVAVQALRELLVPVDDACTAVAAFAESFLSGRGWIVAYPSKDRWVSVAAVAVEALASLLTLTGGAVVVDLATVRHRSSTAWLRLLDAPPDD